MSDFMETSVTPEAQEVVVENNVDDTPDIEEEETLIIDEVEDIDNDEDIKSEDSEDSLTKEGEKKDTITPEKKVKGVQGRINDLTRKRRDAEREVEFWKHKAMEDKTSSLGSETKKEVASPVEKPLRYLYDDEDTFFEALTDWKLDQRAIKEQESNQKKEIKSSADKKVHTMQTGVVSMNTKGVEAYEDYEDVVLKNDTLRISIPMAEALVEMKGGELVAYYLGKNPARSKAISDMSIYKQSVALRSIERQLTKPAIKKVSKAPAPTKKIKNVGTTGVKKDPSKMNMDEWMSWRNKQANQR